MRQPTSSSLREAGGSSLSLSGMASAPVAAPVVPKAAEEGAAEMVLLSFKTWDRTSLDWPGYSNEISLEVLPVRVLLVARLVRRVRECVNGMVAFFQDALAAVSQQAVAAASQALSEAAATSDLAKSARLTARVRGPLVATPRRCLWAWLRSARTSPEGRGSAKRREHTSSMGTHLQSPRPRTIAAASEQSRGNQWAIKRQSRPFAVRDVTSIGMSW